MRITPDIPVIQWYKSNRLDLLFRIYSARGIRMLSEDIVLLHEEANSPSHTLMGLLQRVIDRFHFYEKRLDGHLLRKCVRAEHADRHGDNGSLS